MSGYFEYSKSNNAIIAEKCGIFPLSRWNKKRILEAAKEIDEKKVTLIEKLPLEILKEKFLVNSEWHHTSKYYNVTQYYSFDSFVYEEITKEEIDKLETTKKDVISPSTRRKGVINYIVWGGTRNHPKANKKILEGYIEEKGCFYYVFKTKKSKDVLLKKKIGSNGTDVTYR